MELFEVFDEFGFCLNKKTGKILHTYGNFKRACALLGILISLNEDDTLSITTSESSPVTVKNEINNCNKNSFDWSREQNLLITIRDSMMNYFGIKFSKSDVKQYTFLLARTNKEIDNWFKD